MTTLLSSRSWRVAVSVAVVALLFAGGMVSGPYQTQIAVLAAIYVILASSLNLVLGYSGLLSLGHQAYFGLGAYVSAIASTALGVPMVLAVVASAAVALVVAWMIGRVTLRLRAAFFVIATFAVAEIFRQVALNWVALTGGPMGYSDIPPIGLFGYELVRPKEVFPVVFAVALLIVIAVARLASSGLGYSLRGLAENENLARAVGIDTSRHATIAFSLSGAMAAVAGSLYAHTVGFVSPEVFGFAIMINTLLMVIGGGMGTVLGPVIGAVLFTQLPEMLRFSDEWRLVIYGLVLILLVRFMPRGLWGTAVHAMRQRGLTTAAPSSRSPDEGSATTTPAAADRKEADHGAS
ncbi:branched-chain amino acid ABC transporter permease [Saccharopolyspora elongata]|uniref:branched-chain amino acid ABC transporter permease n=1 Tax=Saccharopolyspora elongata TaxID=2530387 RepID=UPI001F35A6DD|nr:branched-chain amino acid ABC transporter permease [Saccharopolyspora elongata]